MKLKLQTTKPGQSNTDYRELDDEALAGHIATLAAKRPHNWTPTWANLQASRRHARHAEVRFGRSHGWEYAGEIIRADDEVLLALTSGSIYSGVVAGCTSRYLTIRGTSTHRTCALQDVGTTMIRREEIAEVAR